MTATRTNGTRRTTVTSRRDVVMGVAAVTAIAVTRPATVGDAAAQTTSTAATPATSPSLFNTLYERIVSGRAPQEAKITVDLPEIAENGNTVPMRVAVDSPMTAADHVTALHLLSTTNPLPHIATFRFNETTGRAAVATRIRLAASQDIVVLAETSGGTLLSARRSVKVTVGGCGG